MMTTDIVPELLTREQAAALLNVKPQTLAAWASTRRYSLPMVRVGRCVRYRRGDIERWIAERTVGAIDE